MIYSFQYLHDGISLKQGKDSLLWVKSLVMSIYLLNVFNGLHVLLTKLTQDYFSVDDTDFLKKMIIANYLLKSR